MWEVSNVFCSAQSKQEKGRTRKEDKEVTEIEMMILWWMKSIWIKQDYIWYQDRNRNVKKRR